MIVRFEKQDGEWRLIVEIMDADGNWRVAMASVPFEMIADLAPPCETGSGVA